MDFFERINRWFIQHHIIAEEEADIYLYGLQQGAVILLNIVTTVLLGAMFGMVAESILFLAAYMPIRSYAGGYHAKTQTRCYFISILFLLAGLAFIQYIVWSWMIFTTVLMASSILIFLLAPVEALTKELDAVEVEQYKKKSRILILAEGTVALASKGMGVPFLSECIVAALTGLSLMLIVGSIQIHKRSNETKQT